jgi:hypothetical protein
MKKFVIVNNGMMVNVEEIMGITVYEDKTSVLYLYNFEDMQLDAESTERLCRQLAEME